MQKFTYHCHTTFSDGKSSIEEMIAQAVKLGFTEIGITDHVEVHKNIYASVGEYLTRGWGDLYAKSFSDMLPRAKEHIGNIRQVANKYRIDVLAGFEVDFFTYPGWLDSFKQFSQESGADYLITGNHFVTDKACENIIPALKLGDLADKSLLEECIRAHFANIVKAVESGMFVFAAHLDFIRWGHLVGEYDYRDERMEVIEALVKAGLPTEINTKGLASIGDFYPAQWMLKEMKVRKIPVVLSDDAHHLTQLGRDFDKAEAMLEALEYKERFDLKYLIVK